MPDQLAVAVTRPHASGMTDSLLVRLADRMVHGRLTLLLPDGRRHVAVGTRPGPTAELHVRHPGRLLRRLGLSGDHGFADAWIAGEIDSPDLAALLELATVNEAALGEATAGMRWPALLRRIAHLLRPNSRSGARRNIARHYDLGNAFYAAWLDRSMTYSAALFEGEDETLETAQRNKYRRIAEMADLRPGQHVLEIGCGWGGFAAFAARELGCRVTAVTVSRAQHAYARTRMGQAGVEDRVDIRLQDYRDIRERFDRIVSIEMLEAVGERNWPVYFGRLRALLDPGGRAALQVITIDDAHFERYRRSADFIQTRIFPGGMLPSPARLREEAACAGLAWIDDFGFGADYERTLVHWRDRFEAAWPRIAPLGFDERFRRLWLYYLAYCRAGFRTGRVDVRQIALAADGTA